MEDVCSDMSAFHGIRDIMTLDGPTFFALAYRLECYGGAVAAAADREAGMGAVIDEEVWDQEQLREELYPGDNGQSTVHTGLPPVITDAETPALTTEQLEAMFPAAPQIGQEVGLFEISKGT